MKGNWQKTLVRWAGYFFIGKSVYMCANDLACLKLMEKEISDETTEIEKKVQLHYEQVLGLNK